MLRLAPGREFYPWPGPLAPSPWPLVVVLLLSSRHPDFFVHRLFAAGRAARRRFAASHVAAFFAAADFLLRTQSFEDEIDRRCDSSCVRARMQPRLFGELAQPLDTPCLADHFLCRRGIAERERATQIEPF